MTSVEPLDELTWNETRSVLDEEIARLPEKYSLPIILCHLEGKTQDQAAKELGWPRTSLTRRIGKARELLRHQLFAAASLSRRRRSRRHLAKKRWPRRSLSR